MKTTSLIAVLAFAFVLVWLYEANPMNIFQRGQSGQPTNNSY